VNRVVRLAEARRILGVAGKSNQLVLRRLRAIAEERAGDFQLFKLGNAWVTTLEDLQRLVPELVAHDQADEPSVREELLELRARLAKLETALITRTRSA
jgi:hypothetical protein